MVVIQLEGSGLSHIGNAMQPVSEAALRGVQLLDQRKRQETELELAAAKAQIARRNTDLREAEFNLSKQSKAAEAARKQLQSAGKAFEKTAPLVQDLGYQYDMSGLSSAFASMQRLPGGQDAVRRIVGTFGMPQNEQDPLFPLVFGAAASMIPGLREQDERGYADASRRAFEADRESYKFLPDDVDTLMSLFSDDDAPSKSELLEAMDTAYKNADIARGKRAQIEYLKKQARELVEKNPNMMMDPEAREAFARLHEGVSKNPSQDMLVLVMQGNANAQQAFEDVLRQTAMLGAIAHTSSGQVMRTPVEYGGMRVQSQAEASGAPAMSNDRAAAAAAPSRVARPAVTQPMSRAAALTDPRLMPDPNAPAQLDWTTGDVEGHEQVLGPDHPNTHLARAVSYGIKNPRSPEGRREYLRQRRLKREQEREDRVEARKKKAEDAKAMMFISPGAPY